MLETEECEGLSVTQGTNVGLRQDAGRKLLSLMCPNIVCETTDWKMRHTKGAICSLLTHEEQILIKIKYIQTHLILVVYEICKTYTHSLTHIHGPYTSIN